MKFSRRTFITIGAVLVLVLVALAVALPRLTAPDAGASALETPGEVHTFPPNARVVFGLP